jgi:hypothetical protein
VAIYRLCWRYSQVNIQIRLRRAMKESLKSEEASMCFILKTARL